MSDGRGIWGYAELSCLFSLNSATFYLVLHPKRMSQSDDLQPCRSLPLEHRTGSQVFDRLFRQEGAIATLSMVLVATLTNVVI